MKAYFHMFGLLFLVSILVVACDGDSADDLLAQIEDEGVVVVSTDANYEPQSFLDADGNFIGFDIDVATEIADRLGVLIAGRLRQVGPPRDFYEKPADAQSARFFGGVNRCGSGPPLICE